MAWAPRCARGRGGACCGGAAGRQALRRTGALGGGGPWLCCQTRYWPCVPGFQRLRGPTTTTAVAVRHRVRERARDAAQRRERQRHGRAQEEGRALQGPAQQGAEGQPAAALNGRRARRQGRAEAAPLRAAAFEASHKVLLTVACPRCPACIPSPARAHRSCPFVGGGARAIWRPPCCAIPISSVSVAPGVRCAWGSLCSLVDMPWRRLPTNHQRKHGR